MKKQGFTLIELLAVIVILAIIALIATPIVLNIINETKESAGLRSAEMYLDGVEQSIARGMLQNKYVSDGPYNITKDGDICLENFDSTNQTCPEVNTLKIEVKGEKPSSGTIKITGGSVSDVEINLNSNNKPIVKNEKGELVYQTSICTLVKDNGTTGISLGDEYTCEVKPGTNYTFYVLSNNEEDGSTNLIMDRNVYYFSETDKGVAEEGIKDGYVLWISEGEYGCDQMMCSLNNKGPITAMKYLYNATKDWANVPNIQMDYTDDGNSGEYGYGGIYTTGNTTRITMKDGTITAEFTDLKARMPIVSEIQDGHNYLYENLSANSDEGVGIPGYWTLSSSESSNAKYMKYTGSVDSIYVGDSASPATDSDFGVRPVINLKL